MADTDLDTLLDTPIVGPKRGARCSVGRWLDTMTEAQRVRVVAIIDDPHGPPTTWVSAHFKAAGCPQAMVLARHRRRVTRESGDYCGCTFPDPAAS